MSSDSIKAALVAVLSRLRQVRARWHEALASYFDPIGFRDAIQQCITIARTVTFVLQSHKDVIPNFDEWYEKHQIRFAADPVMVWAKKARNNIEKQGDLQTFSQVRSEIIAGYLGGPASNWADIGVSWSPDRIRRSIPDHLLDRHVIENGTLAIERRWVDSELSDQEVLDALAHVYGQLALLIIDLHAHLGIPIPEERPEMGEHLLVNLLADGRLPSMASPLDDRAVYLSIKDGSIVGYRHEFRENNADTLAKAARRYREFRPLRYASTLKTLADVAQYYFWLARIVMVRDGYHTSMFIPLKGTNAAGLIVAPPENRAAKYMLMRDMAKHVQRIGADGLLHISEAWIAKWDDIPSGGYPDEAPKKGEALTLTAANSSGEVISLSASIQRKLIKKHKVKRLGPTILKENERIISMAPVLEVWGKLDVLHLDEEDEWVPWLRDHFGHSTKP